MKELTIHFLGASETVTGSKYVLETANHNLMIDCGVFQGSKDLRLLNWEVLRFDCSKINTILLTHGHLDHVGYLPRLVKQGFRGNIIGTAPTLEIAKIILLDSAKIHEEEAEKANREGYSKHQPALPFFTINEANIAIQLFQVQPKDQWIKLTEEIWYKYNYNGHILGATFIELDIHEKRFVFSGDIGRQHDLLLFKPDRPIKADYLFIESTYGDRNHPEENIIEILTGLIKDVIAKGGNLIIPSFAVERAQLILFILWQLHKENQIPNIPVYIDSPMGNNVLQLFQQFQDWHKLNTNDYKSLLKYVNIVKDYGETWKTIDNPNSKIIIAGSGMITGGRVLTYLKKLIDKKNTTLLLIGYMAEGTRGRDILDGKQEIKFFGKYYPVHAKIHHIASLSAHADQAELIHWLSLIHKMPQRTFLVHGEIEAATIFKNKIKEVYNWNAEIPKLHEKITLSL